MIYFTSDFHLGHKNIIKYCDRPFKDVEEMDKTIIERFFEKVEGGDTVFFLGDLTFSRNRAKDFFIKVKDRDINFTFIIGNHDKQIKGVIQEYCFAVIDNMILHNQRYGIKCYLSHYPCSVDVNPPYPDTMVFLHGHIHSRDTAMECFRKDIGVDNNDFYPYSIDNIENERKNNVYKLGGNDVY